MRYFVDESGVFANPLRRRTAVSSVSILGIPSDSASELFTRFRQLSQHWPQAEETSEIKGRMLGEEEIAATLALLREFGCRMWPALVDAGLFTDEYATRARRLQAKGVYGNFDELVHSTMRSEVIKMVKDFLRMSNPMFVQLMATIRLVEICFRESLIHYALYAPRELGDLHWVFDAKRHNTVEDRVFFETAVCASLQSRSCREPIVHVRQGDYSAFDKCFRTAQQPPPHLASRVATGGIPWQSVDLGDVFRRHLEFADSTESLGLQLADICANAIARAARGNLRREAWIHIGPLLFRRSAGAVLAFVPGAGLPHEQPSERLNAPYVPMLISLQRASEYLTEPPRSGPAEHSHSG